MKRVEGAMYRSGARFLFESVEGLVCAVGVFVTWPLSKHWLANWGSTRDEQSGTWKGDSFVNDPEVTNTRAVTIAAAPGRVWPWIVQFGLGRAGFYSYELLERAVGIPVRNIESVLPQFQALRVGDEIRLHPAAPGVPVADICAHRHVCFGVSKELEERFERPDPARSWSMYLVPRGANATRLILRSCIEPLRRTTLGRRVGRAVEEPIDFIMEQRMLRSLRRLAEMQPGA